MKRTFIAIALLLAAASASAAELTLFGQQNFNGRRFKANDTIANLDKSGFNDRASSVVIREGVWQLCDDAYFHGNCVTLRPGRYPSLRDMGLNNRVSSAREIRDSGRPGFGRDEGPRGRGARVVLYFNPDFHGDRFVVDGDGMRNLGDTNFNDRAQSMRVEGGYWLFCSDADFQGACRTLGPGSYRHLPGELNSRLSSARRVANPRGRG
jgi:hypothetical protein